MLFADGQVVVIGQLMGGIVATLVAHARSDLVDRFVPVEAGVSPMAEADLVQLRAWFDSWPESFVDEGDASEFFGSDARSTPAWVEGLLKTPVGLVRRFDPDAMLETMRVMARTSRIVEWRDMSAPTTLIRATDSVISDRDIADMLAARPGVEPVEIENSGHDVHLEEPARVAAVLARLMDSDV